MKKILRFTGIIIVILLLLAGVFYFFSKPAGAAWFDENWLYRAAVPISSHTSSENNVYITVTLDTSTPIAAGKMQSDCGDLRFTKQNGEILPFFINASPGCNNAATTIQVNFDVFPAGAQTIYYYYGNPSASSGQAPSAFSTEATSYAIGSVGSETQGPGPVAYWKLDDGTGTNAQDSTINNLDGTLNNTPTWNTEDKCIADKCLYFDGTNNENVSKADDPSLDFSATGSFTTQAWVKRNGASSAINYIITKHDVTDDTEDGGYKLYMDASGDFCFGVDDDITWDPDVSACTSAVEFDDDKWHLVTGVRHVSDDKLYLYVDGNQRTSSSDTTTLTLANSNIFYVGVDRDGTSNEWLGFIDEVKIYSYARTAAQIKADYTSGLKNAGTKQGDSAVLGSKTQDYLSNGLVGYWKMDEASANGCSGGVNDSCDSSGNGNNGAWNGNTANTTGKYGNGTSYDGTGDYIGVSSLSLSNSFTMAGWVNVPASWTRNYPILMSVRDNPTTKAADILARHSDVSNKARIQILTGGSWYAASSTTALSSGWHHIVGIYDSSAQQVKLYIDGELNDTQAGPSSFTLTDSLRIGHTINPAGSDTNYYLNGAIDETRIYNRALSPKEVRDLYNFAPGPVGYWKMDEAFWNGTVGEVKDSSGNGNNGTATLVNTKAGKFGRAGSFDGGNTHAVEITPSSPSTVSNSFTVAAWLKPATITGSLNFFSTRNGGNSFDAKLADGTTIHGDIGDGTNWITTAADASFTYSVNTWYYIAYTVTTTGYTIYANGVQVGSGSFTSNTPLLYDGTHTIVTGQSAEWFNGLIDELRVYNYARTAKQIVEDMNAGHPAVGSPVGSAVGHWQFDEGADNTCSGGTNDVCNSITKGTLDGTSTATRSTAGKFGGALSFDGSDDVVTITNANGIDMDTSLANFTYSAWINPTSAGESNIGQVYWKGNSTYLRTDNPSGSNLDIEANLDLATTDANVNVSAPITTSTWHHLVATWDGTTLTVYIDGVKRGTGTGSGAISSDTNNLLIGGTTTANFAGIIDEFKVYNYALTSDEVKLDYNRGSSMVLGALSDKSGNQPLSQNNEYCIPGDTSTCTAPVARWDFEEKTGQSTYDTSGNGNTGTITNAIWSKGKYGSSLNFDGNGDYVTVANESNFDFERTNSFSISAWVYLNVTRSGGEIVYGIFSKLDSNSPNSGYEFTIDWGNAGYCINKSCLLFSMANTWSSNQINAITSTTDLQNNTWYYVTVTYDGSSSTAGVKFYINGVLQTTTTITNNLNATTLNNITPYIGSRNATNTFFKGFIDDLKIYNYARSAAQIAWDYNRGKPVGYWDLDECQGASVYDLSGNGNTGTITIGASGEDTLGTCSTSSTAWGSGATGKRNYSLSFDGTDDYISLGNPSILTLSTAVTFSAWIYPTTTNSGWILNKWASGAEDKYLAYSGQKATLYLHNTFGGSALSSNSTLSLDQWSLITGTYDGSTAKIYVNGILNNQKSASGDIADSSGTVYIGMNPNRTGLTSPFTGRIDDVRVYNYALTATQVKMLMNEGAVRFGPNTGAP